MVMCRSRCRFAYGPADATATHYLNPDWFYLPGFTFLVLAHPGSPGENPRGLCGCVGVCVFLNTKFVTDRE